MRGEVAKYILLDTGFWIGLLDPMDRQHSRALRIHTIIERFHVLVPWPTLYEFVDTRSMKRPAHVTRLDAALRLPGVVRIDDCRYREQALAECLDERNARRPMSLVDRVLRAMIADPNIRMDAVVTFNPGDFSDVCRHRDLELLVGDE